MFQMYGDFKEKTYSNGAAYADDNDGAIWILVSTISIRRASLLQKFDSIWFHQKYRSCDNRIFAITIKVDNLENKTVGRKVKIMLPSGRIEISGKSFRVRGYMFIGSDPITFLLGWALILPMQYR